MSNYSLEVISHHPTFKNKSLRKYYVEGIDSVGAWGDEPFEIKFTNHTWQRVQVKISLDGTDILTGAPANTEVSNDMWVVNGYGTLSLKAWPETNNGGAQFVFTSANNSVAAHTHGDMSNRGIIAAAVYTEGHVEPLRLRSVDHYHYYSSPIWTTYNTSIPGGLIGSSSYGTLSSTDSFSNSLSNASFNACSNSLSENYSESKSTESLVSVGAGQFVDQKITNVAGLVKPIFSETVRVRYLWWDDLVSKLREGNYPMPHATGFPGDSKKVNINLGATPRIGNPVMQKSAQSYLRV